MSALGTGGPRGRRRWALVAAVVGAVAACAEAGTGPNDAGSIEFAPFPAPAIVLGDTLRDVNGVATPVKAFVRNLKGDILTDAAPRYVYADASRDTAIAVDSLSGYVVSLKALGSTTFGTIVTPATSGRIAARFGTVLQVIRSLDVTSRPDSADRGTTTDIATLTVALPDSSAGIARNVSAALSVTVRHIDSTKTVTAVPKWLVKYEVLSPANAQNDTTRGAFMVNDVGVPSVIDTTDGSGIAGRYVRVRPSIFPTSTAIDSVIVRATVTYKGQPVKGAPIRLAVPVKKS